MCVNDMHVFLSSKLFTHLSLCKCRQIYKLRYIRFDNMLWATQKDPSRFLLRFTFPLFFHKTAQAQKNIIFCFTPVQATNHYYQKQSSGAVMLVLGWKNKKMNAGTVIAFLWISCCKRTQSLLGKMTLFNSLHNTRSSLFGTRRSQNLPTVLNFLRWHNFIDHCFRLRCSLRIFQHKKKSINLKRIKIFSYHSTSWVKIKDGILKKITDETSCV